MLVIHGPTVTVCSWGCAPDEAWGGRICSLPQDLEVHFAVLGSMSQCQRVGVAVRDLPGFFGPRLA